MSARWAWTAICIASATLAGTPAPAVQLTGAGATFPYPLYAKWFEAFHTVDPGVTINFQSIGSGGIHPLRNRAMDFESADAPRSDDELKLYPAPILHIPTAVYGVALTYRLPGVGEGLQLSGDVVADMFRGEITRWNDPRVAADNPGIKLPATPVSIAHRSDGCAPTLVLTQYLAAVSAQWKGEVGAGRSVQWPLGVGGKGSEGVEAILEKTPGAIGYVDLPYALEHKLPCASVKNGAGRFVAPTTAGVTVAAAASAAALRKDVRTSIVNAAHPRAYPLSALTYFVAYRNHADPERGKALAKFFRWTMSPPAQAMATPLGFAPLPASVVRISTRALDAVTFGVPAAGQ